MALSLVNFTKFLMQIKPRLRFYPLAAAYYIKFLIMLPFEVLDLAWYHFRIKTLPYNESPVFILGYWRSGTTHLQNLLCLNQDFGYLNFYQSFFSSSFVFTETFVSPLLQFVANLLKLEQPAHRVPLKMLSPSEEDLAFISCCDAHAFSYAHVAPSHFNLYFDKYVKLKNPKDFADFRKSYMKLFQKLSYKHKGKRLVLKTPANLGRIPFLLKLFPKAKFVVINRNPYEVYPSNVRLWKSLRSSALEPISDEFIEKNILETFPKMQQLFSDGKKLIPEENYIELRFEDLKNEPVKKIEAIFMKFNIQMTIEYSQRLRAYVEAHHNKACDDHKHARQSFDSLVKAHWSRFIKEQGYLA